MSSALNIGLSTGNVGIGNRSYNNQLIPASNGRINGVNITALNERTRTSKASAEACVSSWVTRASAANNSWYSVAWAPELSLFAATAITGTGNRVATSPDGINWTTRAYPADYNWNLITWAPELSIFVTVGSTGTGNRVMTSSDGITWTTRATPSDNGWISVTWAPELSLFVAVATSGTNDRVMTSSDGITWTTQTSAANINWRSVVWAPELSIFVVVAITGTGNRVMTSPDGITWTTRASAADNEWRLVTWASELSLFVAVADSGTGNRVMTSPDGITWTTRASPADISWRSVCWAPELSIFVAVAGSGTGNRVMTSSDGITWATRASPADISWYHLTWAPELSIFVAVAISGTGNRVMTSAIGMPNSKSVVKALPSQMTVLANGNVGIGTTNPLKNLHVNGNIRSTSINFGVSDLSNYEEGTYTPIVFSAPAGTTYTQQVGKYILIGKFVHVFFGISGSYGNITSTSSIQISLPFTARTTGYNSSSVGDGYGHVLHNSNNRRDILVTDNNSPYTVLISGTAAVLFSNLTTTSMNLRGGIWYAID